MEADGLKDAFILALATYGKSSQSIASSLFAQNNVWGQVDRAGELKPYGSDVISRMRKAKSYIDSPSPLRPDNPIVELRSETLTEQEVSPECNRVTLLPSILQTLKKPENSD